MHGRTDGQEEGQARRTGSRVLHRVLHRTPPGSYRVPRRAQLALHRVRRMARTVLVVGVQAPHCTALLRQVPHTVAEEAVQVPAGSHRQAPHHALERRLHSSDSASLRAVEACHTRYRMHSVPSLLLQGSAIFCMQVQQSCIMRVALSIGRGRYASSVRTDSSGIAGVVILTIALLLRVPHTVDTRPQRDSRGVVSAKEVCMHIVRIWADESGESHYQDIEIDVVPAGPLGRMSAPLPVTSMILRENDPAYDFDWHVTPRRQYIVMLAGLVEIQVSDGESRVFGPGDIVLVEDVTGKGHKSRSPDGKPRRSIFLPLP
jgi:hypothetical protein